MFDHQLTFNKISFPIKSFSHPALERFSCLMFSAFTLFHLFLVRAFWFSNKFDKRRERGSLITACNVGIRWSKRLETERFSEPSFVLDRFQRGLHAI